MLILVRVGEVVWVIFHWSLPRVCGNFGLGEAGGQSVHHGKIWGNLTGWGVYPSNKHATSKMWVGVTIGNT